MDDRLLAQYNTIKILKKSNFFAQLFSSRWVSHSVTRLVFCITRTISYPSSILNTTSYLSLKSNRVRGSQNKLGPSLFVTSHDQALQDLDTYWLREGLRERRGYKGTEREIQWVEILNFWRFWFQFQLWKLPPFLFTPYYISHHIHSFSFPSIHPAI